MTVSGRAALVGLVALAWFLLAVLGGLAPSEIVAGLVAAALGALAAAGWPRIETAARRAVARGEAWLGGRPELPDGPIEPEPEPDVTGTVVQRTLTTLARELGGQRLLVWAIDRPADTMTPEFALGPAPAVQPAAGSPLAWAVEGGSAMRVDPAPSWSRGEVVVAPIDEGRVLSVETPPGQAPDPERLTPGAEILAALLVLVDRQTDARADRERLARVVEFLQRLAGSRDPGRVPESLARAATDLLAAQDALVASWAGDHGTILFREGPGDGPRAGQEFALGQGDLAHAARVGATVRRGPTDRGDGPPLATDADGWGRRPPYHVVVPLVGPDDETAGVVAAWGDRPPAEQGVRLLEALGPLLGLQMRRATDLVRFRERATADTLTGLPNRAAFDDRLHEEQTRFHRYRRSLALLVIDVDRFKQINDTWGHAAGDAVLRELAERVSGAVRDVDLAARYGGEEIVVLMPETMLRAAQDVADRVRAAVEAEPFEVEPEGRSIPVTVSIGVSACPERVDDPMGLFASADQALYAAKNAGRNRVATAERRY